MLRHKNIERICCLVLAFTLCLTSAYMAAAAAGWITADNNIGYENRLFDRSYVHTIDIVMDDWEGFLATCPNEEYTSCTVVIDGESYKNVAIRGKGNTSLSSVASYGNDRYSFKIEFDHYQTGKSYYGLDKLSLNNLIYDNTYMKDYLAYTLMGEMGVASPLCSFVEIRVNGETFGTYLAVEGVEEAFLRRNYGSNYGELYKPDTMNFGGGRGNGRDFSMDDFMAEAEDEQENAAQGSTQSRQSSGGFDFSQMFGGGMPDMGQMPNMGQMPAGGFERPEGMEMPDMSMFGGFGMGGSGTKLQYVDDDPASYDTIFSSAKTDVTENDQARLIEALKKLSAGDLSAVDQDAMIRYLVVHDFLQNGDSYTGMMVHNYYLYEEDGVLSMIPWDYNLAFGTFQGGSAQSTINSSIDTPVSGGTGDDRPMVGWIFDSEESIAAYHAMYQQFMDEYFASGWFEAEVTRVEEILTPYVANDPTAFCTFEEFELAVETMKQYGELRAQSINNQLAGSNEKVSADTLNLSNMGSMGGGMGGFGGMNRGGDKNRGSETQTSATTQSGGFTMPEGMSMPGGFTMPQNGEMPGGMSMPGGFAMPQSGEMPGGMGMPGGSTMPQNGEMPGGMSMPNDFTKPQSSEAPAATEAPAQEKTSGSRSFDKAERVQSSRFSGSFGTAPAAANTQEQTILLAVCAAALLAAIVVAAVFKRNV